MYFFYSIYFIFFYYIYIFYNINIKYINKKGAGASIDNNDNLEYGNEIIIQYKLNGDFAYKKENWDEAVYYYTKCIIEENNNNNISNIIKSKLYSNRSAAYLENHQYVASFDDALFCIELNPTWPKGYLIINLIIYLKSHLSNLLSNNHVIIYLIRVL